MPTLFGHAKFEVKIFEEYFNYRVLWTLNCSGRMIQAPTVFGHAKFEVKIFK